MGTAFLLLRAGLPVFDPTPRRGVGALAGGVERRCRTGPCFSGRTHGGTDDDAAAQRKAVDACKAAALRLTSARMYTRVGLQRKLEAKEACEMLTAPLS
jgi:hypothetical protein